MSERRAAPGPARWAVEVFGLEKRFITRQGLPMGWGFGNAHWIVSSLIKYRQAIEWCRAVDGIDLKVARGELFGLLGPNGAGKTTLIRCLATLLEIDGGEAFVNGYSVRTQPDQVRLSMNLVGSGHWVGFDWGMTMTQNLHFFGALYGLSRSERQVRIDEVLTRLGLAHLAKATPKTLSSGERQRMLLAKGFMVRAPVYFLDEPTVGLDPGGTRDVHDFLRNELIGRLGTSGILTTHRMTEAEALCTRVAIMDQGRIVACGTPRELKQLAGQHSILEVRGTTLPSLAVEAIRRVPGVRAAATAPVGSGGLEESLRIHCDDASAVVGPVADTLRRHGAQVTSVETQEASLEDAFIALTARRLE